MCSLRRAVNNQYNLSITCPFPTRLWQLMGCDLDVWGFSVPRVILICSQG